VLNGGVDCDLRVQSGFEAFLADQLRFLNYFTGNLSCPVCADDVDAGEGALAKKSADDVALTGRFVDDYWWDDIGG